MSRASNLAKAIGADGAIAVSGNTTLGDASTDTVTFNAATASIPNGINFTNGNFGLGVTPSAWDAANGKAIQLPAGSLWNYTTIQMNLGFNYFWDGTSYKYKTTGAASSFDQSGGVFYWKQAGSGPAGNTLSFTEVMRLDASGTLLLASTSANSYANYTSFQIGSGSAGSIFELKNSAGTGGAHVRLDTTGTTINSLTLETRTSIPLIVGTNSTERVRITSGGIVGIGTNTPWAGSILDVNGNSNFRSNIYMGNSANSQALVNMIFAFDAVAYNDGSNTTVTDTATTTNYSKRRLSTAASGGWFYGPYYDLAPGNYVAKFRLKVASNSSSSNILYIDCAGTNITSNPKGLSYKQLQPNAFAASGVYQYFDIYFTKTAWGGYLEARGLSWVTGITDIYLDHILILPA
jgi:hypothetical protein